MELTLPAGEAAMVRIAVAGATAAAAQPPTMMVAVLAKLFDPLNAAGTWSKPTSASLIVLWLAEAAWQLNSMPAALTAVIWLP